MNCRCLLNPDACFCCAPVCLTWDENHSYSHSIKRSADTFKRINFWPSSMAWGRKFSVWGGGISWNLHPTMWSFSSPASVFRAYWGANRSPRVLSYGPLSLEGSVLWVHPLVYSTWHWLHFHVAHVSSEAAFRLDLFHPFHCLCMSCFTALLTAWWLRTTSVCLLPSRY